ncbi:accessory Sec system protein Asp3 [Streptococcus porcorum]|uniref:Accessory secretory protein Asp3 n=1 Tax=Streptococcus porcorum TaxID=701526 RepID=A0ABV2JE68_9STRE
MTKTLLATIKWDRVTSGNSYLYGSTIKFLEDSVSFENLLMASGKPISRWQSRTNYQGNRRSPALPVLKPGKTYLLKADLESTPMNRVFIRLDFVNRLNENIGFTVLRSVEQEFTYPKDAFSYTITLMSGGCSAVVFRSLSIFHEDEKVAIKFERPLSKRYTESDIPQDLNFVKTLITTI